MYEVKGLIIGRIAYMRNIQPYTGSTKCKVIYSIGRIAYMKDILACTTGGKECKVMFVMGLEYIRCKLVFTVISDLYPSKHQNTTVPLLLPQVESKCRQANYQKL